jgi:ABC-type Fe3+/spermidine/putrescine transport system ATPase subunit
VSGSADHPAKSESQANRQNPLLELRKISKTFGDTEAVKAVDLCIYPGDFLAILGPSGCGKTTLLRTIAGFTRATSGRTLIDSVDVTELGPNRRPTNMVFQGYGLFPHMTVRQNVAYGLHISGVEKCEMERRTAEALSLVHLSDLSSRNVQQLSGGQQQRVALARALIMRPRVLLLDEPLGALDLKLRRTMQEELRRIHHEIGGTFVFVTHDQNEALGLANRIAVMDQGRVIQEGTPQEIYLHPQTMFVSTFIGEANILRGRVREGRVYLDCGLSFQSDNLVEGSVQLMIRPDEVEINGAQTETSIKTKARVVDSVFLGATSQVKLVLPNGEYLVVSGRHKGMRHTPVGGEDVVVSWKPEDHRLLRS